MVQYYWTDTLTSGIDPKPVTGFYNFVHVDTPPGPGFVNMNVPSLTTDNPSGSCQTAPNTVPGNADWPNGTYGYSIDISSFTQGDNYEARLSRWSDGSGGTSQEVIFTGANQTGTGVKTESTTADPSSGATTDRFVVILYTTNTGHMTGVLVLDLGADSYFEGPFGVAVGSLLFHQKRSYARRTYR